MPSLVELVGFSDEVAEFSKQGWVREEVGSVGLGVLRPCRFEQAASETYEFSTCG